MTYVLIKNGSYRNHPVIDRTFRLVQETKNGKKGYFVTVIGDGSELFPRRPLRIKVSSKQQVVPATEGGATNDDLAVKSIENELDRVSETDEQVIDRIRNRFEILEQMTTGAVAGNVRAMIVTGPPGVGKTFGVEQVLEKNSLLTTIASRPPKHEIVRGVMSALGLYRKLYLYAEEGCVLVFDDCDDVWHDEAAINILKAALDTSKKRNVSWNTDSHLLRREGIPDKFEFKGSAIFITNVDFTTVRSKTLRAHIEALESRCHIIDLSMHTPREKMLRIKQIVNDGMLDEYELTKAEVKEIMNFLTENQNRMREVSLRTILKLADLRKTLPDKWRETATITCMR